MTFDVYGKPVALVGHKVVCPKCKGVFPITSGAEDMIDLGASVARHGDKTACGATLIASQATSTWSEAPGDAGAPERLEVAKTSLDGIVAPQTPSLCIDCLIEAARKGSSLVPRG